MNITVMENFNSKKINLLLLFSIVLIAFSCGPKDDNSSSEEIQKNKNVNEWIQSNMDVLYYWNTQLPSKTDMKLYPADYFESILYTKEDRFSFIAEDFAQLTDQLNGVQREAGYAFSLFWMDSLRHDVFGAVDYIKPNSPASSAGLKRGDIFLTINGKQLTVDNYQTLLGKTYAAHTLGLYKDNAIKEISLSVVKYEENPILLDSIYEIGNKKIAYLIFNFFSTDNGDYSYSYLKALNDIFGRYKQASVNELILDLRYNTGGDVDVAIALASMISNHTSSDLFCIDQYNSIVDKEYKKRYGDDYNKTFFDDYLAVKDKNGKIIDQNTPINKLGLNRLYVLVSRNTASASELVINGLKPYMNVTLIGETTYGKNVGMWFIYEEDLQKQKNNRWGMLPIVVKIFNSENKSDFGNGFKPDIFAYEYPIFPPATYPELLPLGDTGEILLGAALVNMGVKQASAFRSSGEKGLKSKPLASSIDRTPVRKNMFQKPSIARPVIRIDDL